jgi:hypothetical protein
MKLITLSIRRSSAWSPFVGLFVQNSLLDAGQAIGLLVGFEPSLVKEQSSLALKENCTPQCMFKV